MRSTANNTIFLRCRSSIKDYYCSLHLISLVLFTLLFNMPVIALENPLGSGKLIVSNWPLKSNNQVELLTLAINWSLEIDNDMPLFRLRGKWKPGNIVSIKDKRLTVCRHNGNFIGVSDICHKEKTPITPLFGKFQAVALVQSDMVYYALIKIPLPNKWLPYTNYSTSISVPWNRLFLTEMSGDEYGGTYYSEEEAKRIVKSSFDLKKLLLTKVEFLLE